MKTLKGNLNFLKFSSMIFILLVIQSCGPDIISFSPESGIEETTVTIEGRRFGSTPADNVVKFGDVEANISSMPSPNKIMTTVPESAVTALLSVTTEKGTGYSDKNFIVPGLAKWTFMVYVDGDNNLEDAAIDDFLEMAEVGSNENLNIVVQMDRIDDFDNTYDNWTGTRRFRIDNGSVPSDLPMEDLNEANMGDPDVLQDFVEWGITNFPAEHYALVIWNHGGGWRLMRERLSEQATLRASSGEPDGSVARAVSWDDTDGDVLYMHEVQQALASARGRNNTHVKLDIIGFDACLMGMIEVGYELLQNALFMVGSEESETNDGWPYNDILEELYNNITTFGPEELAGVIVNKYYESYDGVDGTTQSAINLKMVDNLKQEMTF